MSEAEKLIIEKIAKGGVALYAFPNLWERLRKGEKDNRCRWARNRILPCIKEAGYLPVEPARLEVLGENEMKQVISENITLLNDAKKAVELLFKVSQATIAHNEAKFVKLYRERRSKR